MANYTPQDGLKILNYFQINLSEQEISLFKARWKSFNCEQSNDIIQSVQLLYCRTLPALCANKMQSDWDITTSIISYQRERSFEKKLKETKLKEKLDNNISLEDALK